MNTIMKRNNLMAVKFFSMLLTLSMVFSFFSFPAKTHAADATVTNDVELAAAVAGAQPGDVIVLADGNYSGLIINTQGTAEAPIEIRAANQGKAVFTTGVIHLQGANYTTLNGIKVTTVGANRTIDGKSRKVGVLVEGDHNRITNSIFQLNVTGTTEWVVIAGNSNYNRVDHSDFGPATKGGHYIMPLGYGTIQGIPTPKDRSDWANYNSPYNPNMPRYTQIDHNYFHDNSNGLETICLGCAGTAADYQDTYMVVEYNLFVNCDGDPEMVAIKASNNSVRYNTIITSKGMLSSRAGNKNSIYGNYMLQGNKSGAGGIKIYEKDHKVYNNYIEGASEYPILIGGGDKYTDTSFDHAQVFRAVVANNTIVGANNRGVIIGHGSNEPPVDSVFANNIVQGSAGTLIQERLASNIIYSNNIAQGNLGMTATPEEFLITDPKFTNVAGLQKLSSDSPAINYANASYASFVTEDMDGQPRLTLDVGADEYSADQILRRPQKLPFAELSMDANFTTQIEAENSSNETGDFQMVVCGTCSGGVYMQFPNASPGSPGAPAMLFRLKVANGGPVYVHLYGNGADSQSSAALLSVDSGSDVPAVVTTGNWGWTTAGPLSLLPDGTHDVVIKPAGNGFKLDKVVFSKSSKPPVEALLPKLSGLSVNGTPVSDFSPTKYSYTVKLPLGTGGIPVISASSNGQQVEVIQPQTTFGNTVIYVRDPQDPYFYSRYNLQLTGYPVYGSVPKLAPFPVVGVTASPGFNSGYPPQNVIDGILTTRWAAKGQPPAIEHWVQLDLGESKPVQYALIHFLNGTTTTYFFDLDASEDGTTWKRVYSGNSSGNTADVEPFAFEETQARYIRYNGHGNNKDAWNNIDEIFIAGRSVTTQLSLLPAEAEYSDTTHFRAVLTDTNGVPLVNKPVLFSINDTVVGQAMTGANGEAVLDYLVNYGIDAATAAKAFNLEVEFAGKPDQTFLPSKAQSTFTVRKEQAEIVYTGSLFGVTPNVMLSATVIQQGDGEPGVISGLPVRFDLKQYQKDGKLLPFTPPGSGTVTTDVYGRAVLASPIPAGLYELSASLTSNPFYKEASTSTVTAAVYSTSKVQVQAEGNVDLQAGSGFFGDKAKKLQIESEWETKPGSKISGSARIHAEPQGIRLDMKQADWIIATSEAAYIQGHATDEKGVQYTLRLIMGKGKTSVFSIMIWRGNSAAGQPEVSLLGQSFKGEIQIEKD